jgi:hypothetical protein
MSVSVELTKDDVRIIDTTGGKKKAKSVALHDFVAAIQKDGVLRSGIIARGVREIVDCGNRKYVMLETPARREREVQYSIGGGKITRFSVPFPGLLFAFCLERKRLISSWCFALKESVIKPSVFLYVFPFGNVYEDGKICWGNGGDILAAEYTPANVSTLALTFMNSPFNADLTHDVFNRPSDMEGKTIYDLMKYLDANATRFNGVFPPDVLKSFNTYEELTEGIVNAKG